MVSFLYILLFLFLCGFLSFSLQLSLSLSHLAKPPSLLGQLLRLAQLAAVLKVQGFEGNFSLFFSQPLQLKQRLDKDFWCFHMVKAEEEAGLQLNLTLFHSFLFPKSFLPPSSSSTSPCYFFLLSPLGNFIFLIWVSK